jgi:YbbR domain-containing protein
MSQISNSEKKLEKAKKIASKSNSKAQYETVEENILKLFRWISSIIDRLFFSTKYLGLFALLLACLAYFVATYDSSSNVLSSSKILTNVSINARYNSETFELSGLPTACEIVLTGDAANVNNASSRKGYCQIDLEGYAEGTHTIKMNAVGYGDNVSTIVSPSEVTITLKKKTTRQFDLTYDFINQNQMDSRYILSEPTFAQGTKINIRASQDTLNSIALVKALIDVSGQVYDFQVDAPLVAYDKNGQAVNAEIVPSTVIANVKVSSPSAEVPIVLSPVGQIPVGLAIDTAQIIDHQSTRIYAPESVLNTISEVYVNFDMSTVTENVDREIMLPVTIPNGVSASDVTVVNVRVSLSTVDKTTLEGIPLNAHNNYNNLAISEIDTMSVDVELSGSTNNINSVASDDIEVYFDMPEEPGTYNVELKAELKNNPFVSLSLSKSSVNVTVVEANQ